MKVRCTLRSGIWSTHDTNVRHNGPKHGEIVTVIGEITENGYDLAEYPCPDDYGWAKERFIPVSHDNITAEIANSFKEVFEKSDVEKVKEYELSIGN